MICFRCQLHNRSKKTTFNDRILWHLLITAMP